MDNLTPTQRSRLMSLVRGKDTRPEVLVRRIVFSLGYRYRLHGHLPGRPDLVLPRLRKVVFVHGCFWHRHARCKKATTPAANKEFWLSKFRANRRRDRRTCRQLELLGWSVIVVWECQLKDLDAVTKLLAMELGHK